MLAEREQKREQNKAEAGHIETQKVQWERRRFSLLLYDQLLSAGESKLTEIQNSYEKAIGELWEAHPEYVP
jgi:hypothetical protein